nr:anthrone oxygenase family protein [uncultured Mucilaginibacter sp.]
MNYRNISLALATLTTGLVAGVFYAFAISVNPAFAQLPDGEYIRAMQTINIAIVNPAFAFSFFGAPLLLPLATIVHRKMQAKFKWLLAATIIYLIGSFGVTVLGNIPLNDTLAQFRLPGASALQMATARGAFEHPWCQWHMVRTVASVAALVLLLIACLSKNTEGQG